MASSKGRKGGRVTQRAAPAGSRSGPGAGRGGRATGSAGRGGTTTGSGASADRPAKGRARDDAGGDADGGGRSDAGGPAAGGLRLSTLFRPGGDVEHERPWWGMGDMVVWFLVAQVAAAIAVVLLVPLAGYSLLYPAGIGSVAGEYTGQVGAGLAPSLTSTFADLSLGLQAVLQVPLWLGFLGGPLYVVWRKGTSLKEDFGLAVRWRDVPIGLAIGIGVQALVVPALYWALFKVLGQEYDVSAEARRLTDKATSPGGVVLLLLIVGVGAPVFEELFFRGLSQRAIAKRLGPVAGVVLAGLFFAFAHAQTLQFPALFAFGVLLGFLAHRTGRLGPAIFAHMGFNLTAAVTLVWNLPLP